MEEMVKKTIVYNTKKDEEKREKKNRLEKKKRESENIKVEEIQQQKGRI